LQTALELYEKISKFAEAMPGVTAVEKVKNEARVKIIRQIKDL
jgi:carbon monoxide dehydrogenase subunit G